MRLAAQHVRAGNRIEWCGHTVLVLSRTPKKFLTKRYLIWFEVVDDQGVQHRLSWFSDESVTVDGAAGEYRNDRAVSP